MRTKKIIVAVALGIALSQTVSAVEVMQASQMELMSSDDVTEDEVKSIKKSSKNFGTFAGADLIGVEGRKKLAKGKSRTYKFQDWDEEDTTYSSVMKKALEMVYIKDDDNKLFDVDYDVEDFEGDWGMSYQAIAFKKVKMISEDKYKATCEVKWNDNFNGKKWKIGTATFTFKKKDEAYYGFVLKSVTIKKTTEI